MALSSLHLRRGIATTVATLHRSLFTVPAISSPPTSPLKAISKYASFPSSSLLRSPPSLLLLQFQLLRSYSSTRRKFEPTEEIGPDTILFEGCDYNHWLITMDFPKDPKPTPEEMVATYEKTCAAGLGISLEEAKKRMYSCSTTTYEGFNAVMTEQESEKFREIPGVVFILPDSYIDPQNKEYGGDKYENGHITPRPPPFQYNRQGGGRFRDQNRSGDRPRYEQSGGSRQFQQGNFQFGYQGSPRGDGRNNTPPHYPQQQNYGPMGQGDGRNPVPMNNNMHPPREGDNYQMGRRESVPSFQGNQNQSERGNTYPQERQDFQQGYQRNYGQAGQREFSGDNKNYVPRNDGNYAQGPSGQYHHVAGSVAGPYGGGASSDYPRREEGPGHSQIDQRNMQGGMGQPGTYQGR